MVSYHHVLLYMWSSYRVLILIVVDNGLVLYFKDFDRKEYTS